VVGGKKDSPALVADASYVRQQRKSSSASLILQGMEFTGMLCIGERMKLRFVFAYTWRNGYTALAAAVSAFIAESCEENKISRSSAVFA